MVGNLIPHGLYQLIRFNLFSLQAQQDKPVFAKILSKALVLHSTWSLPPHLPQAKWIQLLMHHLLLGWLQLELISSATHHGLCTTENLNSNIRKSQEAAPEQDVDGGKQ